MLFIECRMGLTRIYPEIFFRRTIRRKWIFAVGFAVLTVGLLTVDFGYEEAMLFMYGVVFAGLLYLLMSALITVFGVRKIMRLFPPVVTGPIIISIGLLRKADPKGEGGALW